MMELPLYIFWGVMITCFMIPILTAIIYVIVHNIRQRRYSVAISMAAVLIVVIITPTVLFVNYNYSLYGWFYSYKADMMNRHSDIYKMKVTEKSPLMGITNYVRSPDENEINKIFTEESSFLVSSRGEQQVKESFNRRRPGSGYIVMEIAFDVNGDNKIDFQYESDFHNDTRTWSKWDRTDFND